MWCRTYAASRNRTSISTIGIGRRDRRLPENAEVRREIGDRVSAANELAKADADLPDT
jgi:hypothetical protein